MIYATSSDLERTLVETEPKAETPLIALRPRGDTLTLFTRCAQTVMRELGAGLEPLFYARALALQLQAAGLRHERESWVDFRFRGSSLGRRRVDFVLEAEVAVELLAGPRIEPEDLQRLRSIVQAAGLSKGVALCFATEPLQLRLVRPRER